MDVIKLSVAPADARRVTVQTVDDVTDTPDDRQGNVDTTTTAEVKWKAETAQQAPSVSLYVVRFYRLDKKKAEFWPFTTLKDGSTKPPAGYVGPLELAPGEAVKLVTADTGEKVKYEVEAMPTAGSSKISPVDPMIIIRPPGISKWLFGLICAVLGAALGAALTYAQLAQCAHCG